MNRDVIKDLRINYSINELLEKNVSENPFDQFNFWFQEAMESQIREPNAMVLSTIFENKPQSRIVLLKGLENGGFVFYTNYKSNKGKEITDNPNACINFFWDLLERQVRINGRIEKITEDESNDYFWSRPLGSQIGAWVSDQSELIESREILDEKLIYYTDKFKGLEKVPRPSHWGGFKLVPDSIEFWQGRSSRLHDRIRYRLESDKSWVIERLSP